MDDNEVYEDEDGLMLRALNASPQDMFDFAMKNMFFTPYIGDGGSIIEGI